MGVNYKPSIEEFFYNIINTSLSMNLLPYYIPVTQKEVRESLQFSERNIGTILGAGIGTIGLICQGVLYYENPECLAIPFITNLISRRYEKRKNRRGKK